MEIIREAVTSKTIKHLYEFGPFLLDPQERLLLRDGQPIKLTDKVFEILCVLVRLMEKVWPDDKFVEEGNLSRSVSTLRKELGESPSENLYIETVPKRGYRFVASVRDVVDGGSDLIVEEHSQSRVVIEEKEETSGQDKVARAFEQDADISTSGFRVMNAEALSRAEDSRAEHLGSVQRATLIPSNARSLLSRVRINGKGLALVGLVALFITALVYALLFRGSPVARRPEIKSLAVLPLKSLSKDANDDYLGLGIADTIIMKVSQNGELTVRPTSAVRKYASQEINSLEAAQQLKVDSVLDGTMQHVGDRLHINLNLLRTQDGASLWSDSFNVNLTDILKMQDEVAQQVATRLRLKLRSQTQISSVNPQAYDFYLRAKYHSSR